VAELRRAWRRARDEFAYEADLAEPGVAHAERVGGRWRGRLASAAGGNAYEKSRSRSDRRGD
jgi:hypothetical protein